ncbi:Protease inhibitor precursor [compost metagenome]
MRKRFKIITGAIVFAAMLAVPFSQEVSADRGSWMPIEVNIEGKLLDLTVDPVIDSGTTLVPMRAIFEALGAEIKWDNKAQKIIGTKGSTKVELTIGSKTAKKNGVATQLQVAPKLVNGSTMIPLRYVSESLDMHVAWINSERQVYIAKDREIEGTTMASVEVLYKKYAPTFKGNRFSEQPSYSAPYKAGKLADGFLQDGLKALNFAREMAGLPAFTLDSGLTDLSQHGAVLLTATGQMGHSPAKADDMDESFYSKAYTAAQTSNIAGLAQGTAPVEVAEGVKQLLVDQSVDSLGHRRHLLNPTLQTIGLGYAAKTNSYNQDAISGHMLTTFAAEPDRSVDYDYVSWPSKGYFPISWMREGMGWSVSVNPNKYQSLDTTKVKGTITNLVDGSVQKLIYGETPGFDINVEDYSGGEMISFYPYQEDAFYEAPNPGDEFVIELTGLTKIDGTPATIKYTTKLFAME